MSAVWFEAFTPESHDKTEIKTQYIVKQSLETEDVSLN